MQPGQQNNFFGVKVSKPGVNVNNASDSQLVYQNNYNAETFYGNTGNISFGKLPNGDLGMYATNTEGNTVFMLDGATWYWYDNNGNTVMMVGYLPVAQIYGWAVAAPGKSLAGVV